MSGAARTRPSAIGVTDPTLTAGRSSDARLDLVVARTIPEPGPEAVRS
jgi:hypothetical protein